MGMTLSQLQSLGATAVPSSQSASTNAYQSFIKTLPNAATPQPTPQSQVPQENPVISLAKDAFGTLIVKPATRIAQAATSLAEPLLPKQIQQNIETNLQKPSTQLGVTVPPQQTGAKGVQQIAGDALKSASYLAAPEAVGAEGTLATKVLKGAAVGAGIGGAAGAGNALENPNTNLTDLAKQTGKGAAVGAAVGGAIPAVVGGVKAGQDLASEMATKTETIAPKDTLQSRIADATPDYNKKIATDYIKNAQGETVPRVNEGKGLTGNRTVNTSASETANGTELNNIKNYPDQGTNLQKYQAVHDAISTEAKSYKAGLAAEDKAAPLVKTAKDQVYKGIFDNLNGDARDAFLGKENKLLSQAGQPIETAKSIVGRYGQAVAEATSQYDGTRVGLQTLKENLETAYQDARGNSAYGSEQRNGIDQMNSSLRDYVKGELSSSTKNTDVLASLDKQSKMYRANEVLQNKAEAEATSHYGRFIQQHPSARMAARVLSRQGIMIPVRILESAAGLGAVYSLAKSLTKK